MELDKLRQVPCSWPAADTLSAGWHQAVYLFVKPFLNPFQTLDFIMCICIFPISCPIVWLYQWILTLTIALNYSYAWNRRYDWCFYKWKSSCGWTSVADSVSKDTPIEFSLVLGVHWTDDISPKDIKEPSTQLFEAGVSESRRELNLCWKWDLNLGPFYPQSIQCTRPSATPQFS